MVKRRLAGCALTLCTGTIGCSDMCANEVLADVPSPDGRKHAIVFERDCGATTDFSKQVSILPVGRAVSDNGNVFVADADHGRAPHGPGGGPRVAVRWLDGRTLEVRHDWRARVFMHERERDGTVVRVVRDSQ